VAVVAELYSPFPTNAMGGNAAGDGPMDLLSDTIKEMLTTSSHTISQTTHELKSSITNEVPGTGGYTTGGHTLASKTYDWSSLTSVFKAADQTYAASTISAAQSHIYDDTPTTPADPLILYRDFGGTQSTTGTDFIIDNDATSGIFQITVAT
jgi:hypothetical protein